MGSVETVRNYYELITVYAPAYAFDVLSQYVDQGRLVYQYIEAKMPVVVEYVKSKATIYLQLVQEYVQKLQVVIPQFVNEIQARLPQLIEEIQAFLLPYVQEYVIPYVQEVGAMVDNYLKMAKQSTYGKLAEEKVRNLIELLLLKFNEVVESYPDEIKALNDFVVLYMDICMKYATWFMNAVFEHPTVQKMISYISSLTPEKAQADLMPLLDLGMTTLKQVETTVTELIQAIPKDFPEFFKLHIPNFFLTLIQSILDYLK